MPIKYKTPLRLKNYFFHMGNTVNKKMIHISKILLQVTDMDKAFLC